VAVIGECQAGRHHTVRIFRAVQQKKTNKKDQKKTKEKNEKKKKNLDTIDQGVPKPRWFIFFFFFFFWSLSIEILDNYEHSHKRATIRRLSG